MSYHSTQSKPRRSKSAPRSRHGKTTFHIKDIILDPGEDDIYGDQDLDNYEDSRIEMRNTGHNLTSVLMNPRETFIQGLFNEFSSEQRQPLEFQSATTSSATSALSMSSVSSSHSQVSNASYHSSTHSIMSTSSNYSTSSFFSSSISLFTSKAEDEQLSFVMNRIKDAYKEYLRVHETYLSSNVTTHRDQSGLLTSPNMTGPIRLGSTTISHEELLMCFREVPEVFFRPEFSLQNIEMFNLAMGTKFSTNTIYPTNHRRSQSDDEEEEEIQLSPMSHGAIPYSHQDQLTKYLDIIELALLNNIWIRSPSFFRVLDDIRSLQSLVTTGHECITTLRKKYQSLSDRMAITVLRIPKLYIRQRNESVLSEKISSMRRVMLGRQTIANMLEMEDYMSALEVIREMKRLYETDLEGLTCMKRIGAELDNYDVFICEVMSNKFVYMAIQFEDDHHLSSESLNSNLIDGHEGVRISNEPRTPISMPKDHSHDIMIGTPFDQLLTALITTNKLHQAINLYKSRLSDSVRIIVRTGILEYLTSFDPSLVIDAYDNPNTNNIENDNTPFASRVREMTNENFLACLSMCYENILIALRKAELVHRFVEAKLLEYQKTYDHSIISVVSTVSQIDQETSQHQSGQSAAVELSLARPTTVDHTNIDRNESLISSIPSTPITIKPINITDESNSIVNNINLSKSCLTTACELSQRSIVHFLNLRKESYGRMTVEKMKFFWEISLHFVSSIEKILGGSSAYIIGRSLLTQTSYFVDIIHEGHKGRLINILDNEKWVQCDVSAERQAEIDRLVSGKSFLSSKSIHSNGISSSPSTSLTNLSSDPMSNGKKDARPAKVDESTYNVVWSVLFLAEVIMTYLDISVAFPSITQPLISKIIELIRLFDHRTRQLVLGAQSIQSAARLKSISARHLAITAQSIDFLSSLLPHIRTAVLAQLPPKHHILLQEFDRITTELLDHHGSIVSKFVSIVSDFIDSSASKLRHVDWDRFQGQCEYFEEVLKNVTALHRVLSQLLPSELLQDIFQRIFSLLNRKIPQHFEEVMPSTQTGKQRIMDDVSHLITTFSRLKQIDCKQTISLLDEIFRKKYGLKESATSISVGAVPDAVVGNPTDS